jgi:DNA-binding PadR family transcriptional regulator
MYGNRHERCHHGPGYRHAGHRGGHRHGGFGGGPRARRGGIQTAILALLEEKPMHGYQIMQELGERSGGAWTPSPGSVYPTLQLLEDQGLLASEEADGKRVFFLTETGKTKAAERPEQAPWDEVARESGSAGRLREALASLASATMQVAKSGTSEQIEETLTVLTEARKRLYQMLADAE